MSDSPAAGHAWTESFARWLFRRQGFIVAGIVAVTGLAILQLSCATFENSLLQVFTDDLREYESYRRRAELLGGDTNDLIYVAGNAGDSLFTPAKLNALRRAADNVQAVPGIDRVTTFVDA